MQRRNSDPTLDSPNEYNYHKALLRKLSNDPSAPTPNPDDPYFPTVPPDATATPDSQIYREHFNPTYHRRYNMGTYGREYTSDYRRDYSESYIGREITTTRGRELPIPRDLIAYRSSFRDDYVPKPLDYRDDYKHEFSLRNLNYPEDLDYNEHRLVPDLKCNYISRFGSEFTEGFETPRPEYPPDDYTRADYFTRNIGNDFSTTAAPTTYRNDNYSSLDYRNETFERNLRFRNNYDSSEYRKPAYNEDYTDYNKSSYDYRDDYTQDYSQRSYEYPRRRYRDLSTRERYNEESVSEARFSEGYEKRKGVSSVYLMLYIFNVLFRTRCC